MHIIYRKKLQTEYFKLNNFNIFFVLYVLSLSFNSITYAAFLSIIHVFYFLSLKLDNLLHYNTFCNLISFIFEYTFWQSTNVAFF